MEYFFEHGNDFLQSHQETEELVQSLNRSLFDPKCFDLRFDTEAVNAREDPFDIGELLQSTL